MALKDLLVHIDNSQGCRSRLQVALDLAEAHGAHLTGLYVLPRLEIPTYLEADIGVDLLAIQQEAVQARAAEAENLFKTAADRTTVLSEWRRVDGGLARTLNLHARYTDLVVMGQFDPGDPKSLSAGVDRVVLESGRPVLIIPYGGMRVGIGAQIMVAWNGSREAVRAIADALPLLARAKKVEVVAVNPPTGTAGEGDIPSADICVHLARHGVNAEAHHIEASDREVGEVLLSRVADQGIDLIVMGAYGHSRLREVVLGGATRHLLHHMTVPVLMSH